MSANTAAALTVSARRRVLIVDDDADTRAMYGDFFAHRGWDVAKARDGREALVLAIKERPSIVVTELWLQFIDGVALCRLLRQDQVTSALPILVVTSETRANNLKRAEQDGASAILIKPSTPDVVAAE